MSRLKVWDAVLGQWQYVGGQQPVLRYVPLDAAYQGPDAAGGSSSTAANVGPVATPTLSLLPTHAVAVAVQLYASHTVVSTGHRFYAFSYDNDANAQALVCSGKVASTYETITAHYVKLGGDRQFKYQIVIGTAGTTTYWYNVLGYWTYEAPATAYPPIGAYGYGTAFPASPQDRDRFFRTDLMADFFWNATVARWLSTPLLITLSQQQNATFTATANGAARATSPRFMYPGQTEVFVHKVVASTFQTVAGTGSIYWRDDFMWSNQSAGGVTLLGSVDGKTSAASRWTAQSLDVNQLLANVGNFELNAVLVGAAGSHYVAGSVLASAALAA